MKPSGLDWAGLMRAGIGGLRLSPEAFWRLTPAELALLLGDPTAVRPLGRSMLEQLRAQWPDQEKGETDD